MRLREIIEAAPRAKTTGNSFYGLFGRGSSLNKAVGNEPDDDTDTVAARPSAGGSAQAAWDAEYGDTHNPDGTPRLDREAPVQDPVVNPTPGGADPQPVGGGSVSYVSGFRNKTRNQAVKPELMTILRNAADFAGVRVVIFSGGQCPECDRRTGSRRHDNGYAADVWVYDAQGNQLPTSGRNATMNRFISGLGRAGARGIGAHPGYMGGVGVHVDLWGSRMGGEMWGAGGTGSPPRAIQTAFRQGQSGRGTATA